MSRQWAQARVGARRELVVVVGLGVAVLIAIGLGAAFATRSVAQDQALQDAERMTRRVADLVVAPMLAGYLTKDPEAVDELDDAVRIRMSDGYLTALAVWSVDGRILYSSNAKEVGLRPQPTPLNVSASLRGRVTSTFEDAPLGADPPVTSDDRQHRARYVDVSVPLHLEGMPPMAVQAYFDYEHVDQVAAGLLRQLLPLVIIPLLLLQLIQIPAALSLARRLKRHENERARLLERALSASDGERVRFAADLHDGPIQDLAGISYALGAVARGVPDRHVQLMRRAQEALLRSIASLRGLMTDLYPPDLGSATLEEAFLNLAAPLQANGVDVRVDVAPVGPLADQTVVALYRVAREALANVAKHAEASTVEITMALSGSGGSGRRPTVRLEITDDGAGLDPARLDRRAEGHLGLRLVADRVDALGGQLTLRPAPRQGTTLVAEVPVEPVPPGR